MAKRPLLSVPEKNPLPGEKRVMKKIDEELHEESVIQNGQETRKHRRPAWGQPVPSPNPTAVLLPAVLCRC